MSKDVSALFTKLFTPSENSWSKDEMKKPIKTSASDALCFG
jgi:hypothetical protein